jgi:hypothetical protein
MDLQTLINIGAGTVLAVIGWLARELWGAVKQLRTDIQRLEVSLPTSYVAKSDFKDALDKIEAGLDRIYAKLDGKADKP